MASSYSRPGVFVNTSLLPLSASPGGANSGAVAAFAAPYNIGPTKPTLVNSFQQYTALFGGFNVANGSALAYAVSQYFDNGGTGCYVLRVPNTDAALASAVIASIETSPSDASLLTLTANAPGAWANGLYYEIVPGNPVTSASDTTATFNLNIYNGGTGPGSLVESWPGVSLNPSSSRNLLSLVNASSGGSAYVTASVSFTSGSYSAGTGDSDPVGNAGTPHPLTAGSDGSTAFTDASFASAVTAGYVGGAWSVSGFGSVPGGQVLNVNLPGADVTVINLMINWAETQGNVYVIIDGPFIGPTSTSATVAAAYTSMITGGTPLVSASCAAVYGPWLSVSDPASSSATATRWVAPGGAVLGVWAANDAAYSVAQTPAGTQALVSAAALEAYFSPADLAAFTTYNINPIKSIPNVGFCIFGGSTLAQGYPNTFINVARTITQFTTDFIRITQYAVFQNNDPTLWASVAATLTNYLNQAMQSGMLAGTVASDSYSVTCDDTINTPATAQAGIVNVQVSVALVSPAEFITISLSQMQGSATTSVSS